jgi:hypothetical protein
MSRPSPGLTGLLCGSAGAISALPLYAAIPGFDVFTHAYTALALTVLAHAWFDSVRAAIVVTAVGVAWEVVEWTADLYVAGIGVRVTVGDTVSDLLVNGLGVALGIACLRLSTRRSTEVADAA